MRARKSRKHPPRPSPPTAADLSVSALAGGGYRVGIRGRSWSAEGATEREALEHLIDDLDAYYAANFPPRSGSVSSERKQLMLLRDGHRCVNCGSRQDLTVDHKIPVSRGGTHDLKNCVTLCHSCNQRKGSHLEFPKVPKWALAASQNQREPEHPGDGLHLAAGPAWAGA